VRLGTRLLLPLLPITTMIMVVYAGWALLERQNTMAPQARREVQAYATALGLALDRALRDVQREDLQALLSEVTQAPAVYAILLYDSAGTRTIVSDPAGAPGSAPLEMLARVLAGEESVSFEREIDDQRVYSVLRAVHGPDGRTTGALEVAQPMASIEAARARVRRRFLLNTVTLLAAISAVTLWLVGRVVARPMQRLVDGARALGRGHLSHRIAEDPGGGELAELAREFNGMAANLEHTRAAVAREAEERLALERRLQEAEKLAAIGNLAAGLAHEIAAPLNVISGRAEMMLRREPDQPTRQRNLGIIVQQIGRITTIVRNLLDFAKRREPRPRPLDLREVAGTALEFLEGELGRAGVTVETDHPGPVPVHADPDLLHQVLVNLILNAVQAMENADGPRHLRLRVRAEEGEGGAALASMEIADTGPGLPDEILTSIFQPFFTTKPRGTGLGLVVARRIVEEHDGQLTAGNGPDGAVFRVTLPLRPVPAGASHG
jgi:two-component system, NtrC family, sensor kinase